MKYTELKFSESGGFYTWQTSSLNSYKKNKFYSSLGRHFMYVDTDKLEIGQKIFKKHLLKHYNNIITKIEETTCIK